MAVKKPPKPTRMIGGIPAYTKQQFLQVRPGGNYGSYIDVLNKKRGLVPGKPPTLSSLMQNMQFESPAQIEARTQRMVAAQVAAQRGLATDAAKTAQADADRLQKSLAAAGNTAAQMNKSLFDQVGGQYNVGAQELANMTTGAVGAASAATDQNVAATNEALGRVGMPGVAVTGQMAGPQQAGVTTYLGGGLPAQNMVQQGQAANFGLAGLISSQNLRSTQEANAALAQSTREIAQQKQLAFQEIARGRPEMAATILNNLQTAQRQNSALAMSIMEAQRGIGQTNWERGITERKLTAEEQAAEIATKADNAEIKRKADAQNVEYGRIDAAASKAAGFLVDRAGRPILDKNGKPIPVAKTGAGTKATPIPGLTPLQAQKQIEKAEVLARNMFFGYKTVGQRLDANGKPIPGTGKRVPAEQAPGFDENDPNTYGTGSVSYATAIQRLRGLKIPQGRAIAMLNQYYDRGDQGRPWFNQAEKKKIMAALTKTYGSGRAQQEFNTQLTAVMRAYNEGRYQAGDSLLRTMLALAGQRSPTDIPDRPGR